ncbi:MAG: hypothetical protein SF053_01530 [Bacteroidia bacterium]|nr:hypothetical protein [Bacteroidia bacterium]
MHIFRILLILASLMTGTLIAQPTVSLLEAFRQRSISIQVEANGGYMGQAIRLLLRNNSSTSLRVAIEAGQLLVSEDSSVQDLIVTEPVVVDLIPGAIRAAEVYTMCTQSRNMSPGAGEKFRLGDMATGALLKLVQLIADRDYYSASTAQSAVWTVSSGDHTGFIYGEDTTMVRHLAQTVSEATGMPMSDFMLTPRRHQITNIRTSLECLIPRHLRDARLTLQDHTGQVLRTYFEGRQVEQGFMQWRLGASHTLGDSARLWLRLTDGETLIYERSIQPTDTILPLKRYDSQAVLIYRAPEALAATVGVYDEAGQLYFLLSDAYRVPAGMHRSTFIIGKDLPADQTYTVRIMAQGRELAREPLRADGPAPVLYPVREVSGSFSFVQAETGHDLQLVIVDSEGRPKRILYTLHTLNPGRKTYTYRFEHRDGPDAVFYIRLTDAAGTVLQEKEIR